ncbi:hypothetical protein HD595_007630 [Nonomuraea roseoviolacea subsp. carminata]|uniref:Uncharacterized protein n=1 Tax=Nonomuraea roseoviolacea subsp. carminata TaxID=160689 RepID=A0ABT1KBX5_9ACTN|nr:hypothetical protein [Nonomuraea roseoviolacea subsp. carminata]
MVQKSWMARTESGVAASSAAFAELFEAFSE